MVKVANIEEPAVEKHEKKKKSNQPD